MAPYTLKSLASESYPFDWGEHYFQLLNDSCDPKVVPPSGKPFDPSDLQHGCLVQIHAVNHFGGPGGGAGAGGRGGNAGHIELRTLTTEEVMASAGGEAGVDGARGLSGANACYIDHTAEECYSCCFVVLLYYDTQQGVLTVTRDQEFVLHPRIYNHTKKRQPASPLSSPAPCIPVPSLPAILFYLIELEKRSAAGGKIPQNPEAIYNRTKLFYIPPEHIEPRLILEAYEILEVHSKAEPPIPDAHMLAYYRYLMRMIDGAFRNSNSSGNWRGDDEADQRILEALGLILASQISLLTARSHSTLVFDIEKYLEVARTNIEEVEKFAEGELRQKNQEA